MRVVAIIASFSPALALPLSALVVDGYDQSNPVDRATHERFASGFPSNPVANTSVSFLANGVDLTGVGWDPAKSQYGLALITPKHLLVARHVFEIDQTTTVSFLGGDATVHTYSKLPEEATGVGEILGSPDLGIVELVTQPDPAHEVEDFPMLDQNLGSGQTAAIYGRGQLPPSYTSPRLAEVSVFITYEESARNAFLTNQNGATVELGDSGSPVFTPWTAPDGTDIYCLLGNNASVNNTYNFHSWCTSDTSVAAINPLLVDDGHAMRWVRDADFNWEGDTSASFGNRRNWTEGSVFNPNPSADDYAGFDSDTADSMTVDLGGNSESIRGAAFAPGGSGGFTIQNGTLTLGRGGLANWDSDDVQTITAGIILADHQHWFSTGGGFMVNGSVNTGGKLVVISGSGDTTLSGGLTGTGTLAVDTAGTVTLSAAATHSGTTWIHQGVLLLTNPSGSATGTGPVEVERWGTLRGSGEATGTATNRGTVSPGNSLATGILALGGLTQTSTGAVNVRLAGTTAGTGYDQLDIAGTASLAGALNVSLDGYTPGEGDLFDVLTCGTRSGTFATVNLPALSSGLAWVATYDPNGSAGLRLEVVAENSPPTVDDAAFTVSENVNIGTTVGTVSASDPDDGDTLTYAITDGDPGGLFAITHSGLISTAGALDHEATARHVLTVTVTDSGSLTDTATVTIDVEDVDEGRYSEFQDQFFTPTQITNGDAAPDIDFDKDGTPNAQEWIAGTDPTDPDSRPTPTHLQANPGGGFDFTYQIEPDTPEGTHAIQSNSDLQPPWSAVDETNITFVGDAPVAGHPTAVRRTVTIEGPPDTTGPRRNFRLWIDTTAP